MHVFVEVNYKMSNPSDKKMHQHIDMKSNMV
jgi:hypothetical protein